MKKVKVDLYCVYPKKVIYEYVLSESQYNLLEETLKWSMHYKFIDFYVLVIENMRKWGIE